MIVFDSLRASPFPWVVLNPSNEIIARGPGSLFPQSDMRPEEMLVSFHAVSFNGWGCCASGLAFYRFTTGVLDNNSVILYGMKVTGVSTAQGKSNSLSIRLDKEHVTNYVAEFCAALESLDSTYNELVRENIHEIRGINSALYNTAYGLQQELDHQQNGSNYLNKISKSVVSLSQLLSARIDFMEFIASPTATGTIKMEIPVYKKFDKLQRCFMVTADQRNIALSMQGSSTATVLGPPVFDIVPYLLLDNAVKYSPDRKQIVISCHDTQQKILCEVTSIGPQIKPDEILRITQPKFRGENAKRTQKSGSGFGLAVLDRIVRIVFNGSLEVTQSDIKLWLNNIPYTEITFLIKLPISKR